MGLSISQLNALVNEFGGGDINNVLYIATTNNEIIDLDTIRKTAMKGVQFREDLEGFIIAGQMPHTMRPYMSGSKNEGRTIAFVALDAIDKIAFRMGDIPPAWVNKDDDKNPPT